MTSYCGMIPFVAFFFFCLAKTWIPPYRDPAVSYTHLTLPTNREV